MTHDIVSLRRYVGTGQKWSIRNRTNPETQCGGKMTWFISGPMSGIENYNHPAFFEAEERIRKRYPDAAVLNPARLPTDLNPWSYMPIDLAMLRECDYIYVLPGWVDHSGCRCEVEFAKKIGVMVVYAETDEI